MDKIWRSKWLVMEATVCFRQTDTEAFAILEKIARDLGIRAAQLDATIWTYQRTLASTIVFKKQP
jgi:hypothetical protein